MVLWNNSDALERIFLLILGGFHGLKTVHAWLLIPFCLAYLVAFIGNITNLSVVWNESSLHQPMYYLLSILAIIDLVMSMSTFPRVLAALWWEALEIQMGACFAQLFFIHTFTFLQSSMLLAMAFDRFMAICHPPHYSSILTNDIIGKTGLGCLLRSAGVVMPTPILLRCYHYCHANVLSHPFCLHQDILKLSCSDASVNNICGLCVVIITLGTDSVFTHLSYVLILQAALGIASAEERLKALNTCLSHVCVVLNFFVPLIGVCMVHRFGKKLPPIVHILMADNDLLLPPVRNPIIYSIRTKQIPRGIIHMFRQRRRL
ncbi:olfactory receptor 51L1-like [Hippopotamus amphibius kiboko]|uniref:olfactory receptor 51L1-like n=1 Tax=Hippopotamus amphibius kiboko TaxID=575201 RepID=UPI0025969C1B|nr:olfactory receptor 51L1-like [Hippopotamus amphibius kiboko]